MLMMQNKNGLSRFILRPPKGMRYYRCRMGPNNVEVNFDKVDGD